MNGKANWIVGYDIAHPKRLGRIYRFMKKNALPLQYSLWLVKETPAGIERLKRELLGLMDVRSDDVRIYRIPSNPEIVQIGRTLLPDDLMLLDAEVEIAAPPKKDKNRAADNFVNHSASPLNGKVF